MAKRLLDIVISGAALAALAPVLAAVAAAVRLSSPGPALYRARRIGKDGQEFLMHKFRTMHVDQGPSPARLTAPDDPRVFGLGAVLRRLKVDELPQLYDVLRGKMTLVGPRPEDPAIVREHYTDADRVLLGVLPGLTSPATLYDYTHGDRILAGGDVEDRYISHFLPLRLALDRDYLGRASFAYDLAVLGRTLAVIALVALGRTRFREPPELMRLRRRGVLRTATLEGGSIPDG